MPKARKEIDKDMMFQRIMPSADFISKKAEEQETVQAVRPVQTSYIPDMEQLIDHSNTYPRGQSTVIINVMEKAVGDSLESVLDRFKCCKCDRCKKDIIALSLNALPPKYVVAYDDKPLPDSFIRQKNTEITTAIVRAVIKVKSDPRH